MESSEDDAGTATNASRRASAREKDVGLPEDNNATPSFQQEPSEARTSCQTPAISEDNFDGDSVPSPSTQDVNTSTEAILDMIDEIVDGPGAPKRLQPECDSVDAEPELVATTSDQNITQESNTSPCENIPLAPPVTSPDNSATSEITVKEPSQVESLPHSDIPADVTNEHSIPESSTTSHKDVSVSGLRQEESPVNNETPNICPVPNISSSSGEQIVQSILSVSECVTQERTVKHVTSSDNRDNVTIESAESTSSDSNVSEGKSVLLEPQTRSPLRRRLVRPAPSDRRPDSTVSSTVDSQINASTTEQSSSEHITKDVTSSSDAVPTTHGIKPEEIRNVSEINVCKAETSISSPKKIKLVRQKLIPGASGKNVSTPQSTILAEKEQCQSTSDNHAITLETMPEPTVKDQEEIPSLKNEVPLQKERIENTEEIVCPAKHSLSISEQPGGSLEIGVTKETLASDSISVQSVNTLAFLNDKLSTDKNQQAQDVTPEKSTTSLPSLLEPTAANILEPSKVEICSNTLINDSQPLISNDLVEHDSPVASSTSLPANCDEFIHNKQIHSDEKKVPPFKLNFSLSNLNESKQETDTSSINKHNITCEDSDPTKHVPKLTIKIKQPEEVKLVPKLTIKPIKPPQESEVEENIDSSLQVPTITKINIKPIPKLSEVVNEKSSLPQKQLTEEGKSNFSGQVPNITKLNIKPLLKPPEKINDIHRKSSSSEISESEYSENDESTSTSDQASASDHGSTDVVPKVTIKMGKPGTESEGKFYTEKNVPKLTIKNIQPDENNEQEPKLKVIISQSEDIQPEKVPKLTIKTFTKSENQPLSPKLTIKPLKPPDSTSKEVTAESYSSELKESPHVPKITIKPVTRTDTDTRQTKKSSNASDSPDYIPIVTKLNIKPILKPVNDEKASEGSEDKVPVVSKLNIKPVIKPKDNDLDSSIDDIPKVTKLNIKPLKNPEEKSSVEKDCDELNADADNSIPVITKLNIKPIVKPQTEENFKDSENQSSETGNSSDDNTDHIPVVTKLNIKPIVKPDNVEEPHKSVATDLSIPVVTKLNIKPVVKPGENASPSSPIKVKTGSHSPIPVVTKINIKPIVRPDDIDVIKPKEVNEEVVKNPPLVMKINMKSMTENTKHESSHSENTCNNIDAGLLTFAPQSNRVKELKQSELNEPSLVEESTSSKSEIVNDKIQTDTTFSEADRQNCVPDAVLKAGRGDTALPLQNDFIVTVESSLNKTIPDTNSLEKLLSQSANTTSSSNNVVIESSISEKLVKANETDHKRDHFNVADSSNLPSSPTTKMSSVQNCTLLKKLLEKTSDSKDVSQIVNCTEPPNPLYIDIVNNANLEKSGNLNFDLSKVLSVDKIKEENKNLPSIVNDIRLEKTPAPELNKKINEHLVQPLEISISDKMATQSSGQDSPRIILKINKTDHGPSAKIITEDPIKSDLYQQNSTEGVQELPNNQPSPNKHIANMKKKLGVDGTLNLSTGKRLRSSRIVESTCTDKSPIAKKNVGKRSSETSPTKNKESEVNMLQTKRLKLEQLLSNKSLSITPVTTPSQVSPTKASIDIKQSITVNHTHLLNNENCSKNGSSKLHNILSNLQAKQMQSFAKTNCSEKAQNIATDLELNASTSSSDLVDLSAQNENSNADVQELMINENSDLVELGNNDNAAQDPLEIESLKSREEAEAVNVIIPKSIELTPQPKKRGRPRKLPVSEGAKPIPPVPPALPVPALEERPQRSLRLMRDRPTILAKPRGGRGRGRGARRMETPPPAPEPVRVPESKELVEEHPSGEIDPTSSRIKLPRMTEALDKMPSVCSTPLSSRRRESSGLSPENSEFKVCDSSLGKIADMSKSPETVTPARGRGRGGRGGRGRTPRGRGRGRGGGRGAVYMKETMGIYGRVCGPATTTVQLFEEETCMMDDNATPAKSSHLLDEDSQSSVKSSTNESSKMKKSKFADLFDSNKVWTAADVKEYTWPLPGRADDESKVMMIQEQVAMFLNVKSFKRRYSELKRRTICGEERDYVLSKGLVTEALCDLGITAVDASEVLDIMLSDYPHKYEEYRSYQRQRQLTGVEEEPPQTVQSEDKTTQTENIKQEKPKLELELKPEVPKVDPEKTRQDMAAAAIASASEWNARANALRRGACADLQSLTVLRPRAPPAAPARAHLRPPAGFYPHALLPGQYQHTYRLYPADQLRYFPLNTVLSAPPAGAEEWSSESEREWRSDSDDSDLPAHLHLPKRKRLTKTKRSSQNEMPSTSKEESRVAEEVVDLCKVCKLRLEANRRYTHERFLVCANCNAKLHPSCLELNADTIRKCREYPWQCAECKTCCSCRKPADDDKMLFCDLCDRGFHIYCVGLDTVPTGRWHCVECAVCKSCGARSAWGVAGSGAGAAGSGGGAGAGAAGEGEAEWHHQTRRGPGGHKVYSHSLCTPCARAYRIGRYCPLCDRSFIGPKGTMQLVICKLCDRQLHQECVKQTVTSLSVLDYTCAECRRGGITSRAAAVRLAPRTIATLFMAKRRFNKYAHRQYMESRQRAPDADAADTSDLPDAPDAIDAIADASDNSDA